MAPKITGSVGIPARGAARGYVRDVQVVAAVDKFRGTATAAEVAAAIGHACWEAGHDCIEIPLADGGEGLLDVLGGPNRHTVVTGPLGDPVEAGWRLHRGTAIIEMARASGLVLAGGADGNDPMEATTRGTGELIDAALTAGGRVSGSPSAPRARRRSSPTRRGRR
jgi:glycerate kinase